MIFFILYNNYSEEKNIVLSVEKFTSIKRGINNKKNKIRCRICYENINDKQTLKYVVQVSK